MTRRWVHCGCIAVAAVAYIITLATAAPVLKEDSVANEKPLVRTKRADEIIFNGQQDVVDGTRIKKSDVPTTDSTKSSDAGKSEANEGSATKEVDSKTVKEKNDNVRPDVDQKDVESNDADESTGSEKQSSDDSSDNNGRAGGRVWDEDDYYGGNSDQRRRRRATVAAGSKESAGRQERSVKQPAVAMVAENMALPVVSAKGGGTRLQRAKRELDADVIRELLDSRQEAIAPSGDERATFDYNDYGPVAEEERVEEQPQEEIVLNGGGGSPEEAVEEPYNEEGVEFADDGQSISPENYFTADDRRPKRHDDDEEEEEEDDEEAEEEYEDAEREVVRQLLAERVAEETRQALLAYLSSNENEEPRSRRGSSHGGGAAYRSSDRFDLDDGEDDETAFADEDEDDGRSFEDGETEEDGRESDSEEIDDNDDRLSESRFLGDEEPQSVNEMSEQKRFTYPYSYEPYGGRWGALVPGAKRSDRDPYDRLYRLAEALSRPTSIGEDDYKK